MYIDMADSLKLARWKLNQGDPSRGSKSEHGVRWAAVREVAWKTMLIR